MDWLCIIHEDFVFSFKNTLEVAAYSLLEKTLSQWKWKLQNEILVWEQRTKYIIETCDCEEEAQKELIEKQLSKVKELNKQWESEIADEKMKFFEGEYKKNIGKQRQISG